MKNESKMRSPGRNNETDISSGARWKVPWTNVQVLPIHEGEMTPFIFKGRDYRVENIMHLSPRSRYHDDHFLIRDLERNRIVSIPLMNHFFGTAYVAGNICYCFALDYEEYPSWQAYGIDMIRSSDLITWSRPQKIFTSPEPEHVFNNAVAFDGKRYVMLYETDAPPYPKYTFKFLESIDLVHWVPIPDAIYGDKKYVGGPAMYFIPEDGFFYVTYVNEFTNPETGELNYDTRITRTKNFTDWENAPENRPVLSPDYVHRPDPMHHPDVFEINASDAEFIEKNGKVTVYYCGGNQQGVADNKSAEFKGTLAELFQSFFL